MANVSASAWRARARRRSAVALARRTVWRARSAYTRASLQREFADLTTRLDKTAILVTHDVREALILARRIGLMHKGQLVLLETPEHFLASDHPQAALTSIR